MQFEPEKSAAVEELVPADCMSAAATTRRRDFGTVPQAALQGGYNISRRMRKGRL